MVSEAFIWAILLLPLGTFAVIGMVIRPFFNRFAGISGILLIGAMAAALALSLLTLQAVIGGEELHFEGHKMASSGWGCDRVSLC